MTATFLVATFAHHYFCMKTSRNMTATWLREGRISQGLTQKELAERSNISVRSIQRIENGELTPRAHTLKTLAQVLNLPLEQLLQTAREQGVSFSQGGAMNFSQRMVLSVGAAVVVVLVSLAFMAQMPTFPETTFEALLFAAGVVALIAGVLFVIWRSYSKD